jgi:Domain of unknown function (DUF4145)
MAEEQTMVYCARCGDAERNHRILYEKATHFCLDEGPPSPTNLDHIEYHRLAQCMGCDGIKYVISEADKDKTEFPPWEIVEKHLKIYPDAPEANQRVPAINQEQALGDDEKLLIPPSVWKMYNETVQALNANIRTLAGGGLRATVEAICLDNEITQGNLQNKIDQLAEKNLLTKAQAELLHEERYIGNAALHELQTPTQQDIEDGLGIVEGLINTIYILPSRAKRLRKRREFQEKG